MTSDYSVQWLKDKFQVSRISKSGAILRLHADPPIRVAEESGAGFQAPPSQTELVVLTVLSGIVMWITAYLLRSSHSLILEYGDNSI